MFNPAMLPIIATRESFEAHLKTMSGLEFVVAEAPAETAPGTGTGVWVIRKQTRRKVGGGEDEIIVHGSYFVMGENIYMAPSLFDIMGSKMLNIFSSLDKFVSAANALPNFTPERGHTYFPSKSARAKVADASQGSRAGTPMPDVAAKPTTAASNTTNSYLDDRLLEESFNLSLRYGDEYMDENPITGQPGAFNLTSTGRHNPPSVQSLRKTALQNITKAAVAPAAAAVEEKKEVGDAAARPNPTRKKSTAGDKSGKPKIKRKKSKVGTASGNITPV